MISQTILSDLTPIMSDSYASNSKHKISWIADLQTTVGPIHGGFWIRGKSDPSLGSDFRVLFIY